MGGAGLDGDTLAVGRKMHDGKEYDFVIDVELGGDQSERTIVLLRLFDAFIPVIASAIAIWAVATFGITKEKAREIRRELEERRGVVPSASG